MPAAAPVSMPPFIAQVITSSTAAALPRDRLRSSVTRLKAISSPAKSTITAAPRRCSSASVAGFSGEKTSRKK